MCKQHVLLVFSIVLISFTDSLPPPEITKCKADDTKCLKKTSLEFTPIFAKGLEQYNVGSLDPTTFKSVNASKGDLLFLLTDVTARGLSQCKIQKIERDVKASKINLEVLCTGQLDGQYELHGNLLLLPIEGKGPIHVTLRDALVKIDLFLVDKPGEDGKNHWQIKSWNHSFELKGKADVKFERLYEGNEVLGRAANELVANYGNDIVYEIGPPMVKAIVARAVKYINNFFKAVPQEDLSLD